jgi:RNA-directed DNA polymerase
MGMDGSKRVERTQVGILCPSEKEANEVLEQLRRWVAGAGLTLHPTKTRIVNASLKGGFDFLGYHFERGLPWPRQKSLDKFSETIREKTGRSRPGSIQDITAEVNRTMRGWFEYFKHSICNVFGRQDQWVRGRLRAILRKRHKGQGRARGIDHQRWPNAYFAELGLFSLFQVAFKMRLRRAGICASGEERARRISAAICNE